jgi:hypothetical protein
MATKRPAKLAIGKKKQEARLCPETGKPMTATKVFRSQGGSSIRWVVIDDFDGGEKAVERMLPVR